MADGPVTDGVAFPEGGDGRRSTTATGRAVFADSARAVDPALAARLFAEAMDRVAARGRELAEALAT